LWSGLPRYVDGQPDTPDFIDEIATSLSEAVDEIAERLSDGQEPPARTKANLATEARNAG
jgi:DNA-binding ferritin-like protein